MNTLWILIVGRFSGEGPMESEVSAWDALSDRGRSDQHWMDDIGHNFVDSGLAEQMEGSSCGLGGKREMVIPRMGATIRRSIRRLVRVEEVASELLSNGGPIRRAHRDVDGDDCWVASCRSARGSGEG